MATKASKTYTKRTQSEARRMARGGRTDRQIARATDVPKRIVKRWTAPEREARRRDRAKRMAALGYDERKIAGRLDATVAQVRGYLAARTSMPANATQARRTYRRCRGVQQARSVTHIAHVLAVTPNRRTASGDRDENVETCPAGRRGDGCDSADVRARTSTAIGFTLRRSKKWLLHSSYLVNGRIRLLTQDPPSGNVRSSHMDSSILRIQKRRPQLPCGLVNVMRGDRLGANAAFKRLSSSHRSSMACAGATAECHQRRRRIIRITTTKDTDATRSTNVNAVAYHRAGPVAASNDAARGAMVLRSPSS
jgi:hypothetical protein